MRKTLCWFAAVLTGFLMFPLRENEMHPDIDPPGTIQLPAPARSGVVSLEEAIAQRRSAREFLPGDLTYRQLSQLLWAAQGITSQDAYRTAPSAGALYPLETYVVVAAGFYHYAPGRHQLNLVSAGDMRRPLFHAALEQQAVIEASAIFVIAAVYERTAQKYGPARGERYAHLEAGHAAQNLLLEAVALGLGAVPMGAFQDGEVKKLLELPRNCEPLYLIPVGTPR